MNLKTYHYERQYYETLLVQELTKFVEHEQEFLKQRLEKEFNRCLYKIN